MRELNEISRMIIGASFRIAGKLGPGLLESVYETVLARDLARLDLRVERQKPISFDFEGLWFDEATAWTCWSKIRWWWN
jgi:GxxExxY protein